MDTIDDIGRRAAATLLADADAVADVEAGLDRIRADAPSPAHAPVTRRRWAVVGAAAAIIVAFIAGVLVSNRASDGPRLLPATNPPVSTVDAPTPTSATPTTVPATVATTSSPTSPATTTTTATDGTTPPPADGLSVSYLDPPPLLEPAVFAILDLPDAGAFGGVGVTEDGAVVIDRVNSNAVLVDWNGSTSTVPLDVVPYPMLAGPGDVLYGLVYESIDYESIDESTQPAMAIQAIALSGDRAGQVVASEQLSWAAYELATNSFGHGPSGVLDLIGQVGQQVLGYVDPSGAPMPTMLDVRPVFIDDSDVVRREDGGVSWPLEIERHPQSPTPYTGYSPPAPTADGGAVVWTGIGPPETPGDHLDYPDNSMWVVGFLAPDGSARWNRIPDGWWVAASDLWGTVLARSDGEQLQLATPAPIAPASTRSDNHDALAELAGQVGASELAIRTAEGVSAYRAGSSIDIEVPDGAWARSDGTLLFWTDYQASGPDRSVAVTFDGQTVCDVQGVIHRVRQREDGSYVASVERAPDAANSVDEEPVPNFAIDCATGEEQPIDPVSWSREAGGRSLIQIGERTFMAEGDDEGNAYVTNETGVSISGSDYAGDHEFDADGSRVVYGDFTNSVSPLRTTSLRARDTTSGDLLWSTELELPYTRLTWFGDRLLVPQSLGADTLDVEQISVLDAGTGEILLTVPTTLDVVHVG